MAQFWLATFTVNASPDDSAVASVFPPRTPHLAIEVLRNGEEWAVLISSVDDPLRPATLTCHLGFVNVAKACNVWLDRGFPLIDADIRMDQPGVISIVSPFFVRDQSVMQYEQQMLSLSGVELGPGPTQVSSSSLAALAPSY